MIRNIAAPACLCHVVLGEAPIGAKPSAGTVSFFADYELRFDPAQLGAPPLQWRLQAWHFQQEFIAFQAQRDHCVQHCAAPPLNTAFFVVSLPEYERQMILSECPGLLLASTILVAETRLYVDKDTAQSLFNQVQQLRLSAPAPGWGLDMAARSFEQASNAVLATHSSQPVRGDGSLCSVGALDIVIAHCKEDLSWLVEYAGRARVWVYEKCAAAVLPRMVDGSELPCITVEKLPNLAMESLAYATHMFRRYGDFADATAFVQGAVFEHTPKRLVDDALDSAIAGTYTIPFLHLNTRRFLSGTSFCVEDLFQRLFPERQLPDAFGSYCCSQFIVQRERLLSQQPDFYERIVAYLMGELPLACAQDDGYDARPRIAVSALFEHLWHVVLGEDPVLPLRYADGRLPVFARVDAVTGELPEQLL